MSEETSCRENEVSGGDVRRECVSELVRWSTGLLGVLALIVLCVIGRVILRLLVVTLASLLSVGLTTVTGAATAIARSSAITRRTIAIVALLGRRDAALPDLGSSPRRDVGPARGNVMSGAAGPRFRTISARPFAIFSKFSHQASVLGIEAAFHHRGRRVLDSVRIPIHSTVTSHMSRATTDTANDVCCKITLFGAVVLAVTNTAAVLANLVFVIAERTV